MELTALAEFLDATTTIPAATPIRIYLDSRYVIDSVTKWAKGWRRNGWKTKDGSPVKNVELMKRITASLDARPGIELVWVRGHSGHHLNEAADTRARRAAIAASKGQPCPAGPGWRTVTAAQQGPAATRLTWPRPLRPDVYDNADIYRTGGSTDGWWAWRGPGHTHSHGLRQFASTNEAILFATMSVLRQISEGTTMRLIVPAEALYLFTPTPDTATVREKFLVGEVVGLAAAKVSGWVVSAEMSPLPRPHD